MWDSYLAKSFAGYVSFYQFTEHVTYIFAMTYTCEASIHYIPVKETNQPIVIRRNFRFYAGKETLKSGEIRHCYCKITTDMIAFLARSTVHIIYTSCLICHFIVTTDVFGNHSSKKFWASSFVWQGRYTDLYYHRAVVPKITFYFNIFHSPHVP